MPIELYWDDDARTTMLCEVQGRWTWDEMWDVLHKIKKVTDSADHEIAAIVHVIDGLNIPGGTIFTREAFDHARRILRMGEGGTGPIIVVGVSPLIRTIYNTFLPMDRKTIGAIRFADSVDDARALLTQRRQTRTSYA
jgi:hypothetical protein